MAGVKIKACSQTHDHLFITSCWLHVGGQKLLKLKLTHALSTHCRHDGRHMRECLTINLSVFDTDFQTSVPIQRRWSRLGSYICSLMIKGAKRENVISDLFHLIILTGFALIVR